MREANRRPQAQDHAELLTAAYTPSNAAKTCSSSDRFRHLLWQIRAKKAKLYVYCVCLGRHQVSSTCLLSALPHCWVFSSLQPCTQHILFCNAEKGLAADVKVAAGVELV